MIHKSIEGNEIPRWFSWRTAGRFPSLKLMFRLCGNDRTRDEFWEHYVINRDFILWIRFRCVIWNVSGGIYCKLFGRSFQKDFSLGMSL